MRGVKVRVVSMPCRELFARQPAAYRDEVLDPTCAKRLVVEAGSRLGWEAFAGPAGKILSIDGFGTSGPYKDLATHFGFTADNVLALAKSL
jgi:transketolase